jgi:hypothetical protein
MIVGPAWASADGPAVGIDPMRPKMYHSPKHGFLIAKPEPWILLTSTEDLERECVGLVIEDSDELVWDEGLAAVTNITPLEPSGLLAVPFSPRIEIDVYRITAPLPDGTVVERVVDELVRGLQSMPDMYAQVVVPPTDIELSGKSWRMVELSAKMRLPSNEEEGMHDVHTRVEVYAHAAERKLFLVQFVARTFDVPTYRPAVQQIIGSITLVKSDADRRAESVETGTHAEQTTASMTASTGPTASSRSWTRFLWGWWRRD